MVDTKLTERISKMLVQSREMAGMSQSQVAKAMEVSKTTVQNWEYGLSCPTLFQAFKWFDAVDVPIMPFVSYVCHSRIDELSADATFEEEKEHLKQMIDELPQRNVKELLFMLEGEHGASIAGVLDGFTAYLHLPLKARVSIMQTIGTSYLLCKADNSLSNTDRVMPDRETLHEYVQVAYKACEQGKNTYI